MRRFGRAAEVADAIFYLASPAAAYVSGACLTIDGGWCRGKGMFGEGGVEAVRRGRGVESVSGETELL